MNLVSSFLSPGPFVECLNLCNSDPDCGGFWIEKPVSGAGAPPFNHLTTTTTIPTTAPLQEQVLCKQTSATTNSNVTSAEKQRRNEGAAAARHRTTGQ